MNRPDVFDLMIEIKQNYPAFDVSDSEVDRHFRYLQDFSREAAFHNLAEYIKTNAFPPKIADIRGRLGDQLESESSKQQAAQHIANIDTWRRTAAPPPTRSAAQP